MTTRLPGCRDVKLPVSKVRNRFVTSAFRFPARRLVISRFLTLLSKLFLMERLPPTLLVVHHQVCEKCGLIQGLIRANTRPPPPRDGDRRWPAIFRGRSRRPEHRRSLRGQ